jgi:hypothetical protein
VGDDVTTDLKEAFRDGTLAITFMLGVLFAMTIVLTVMNFQGIGNIVELDDGTHVTRVCPESKCDWFRFDPSAPVIIETVTRSTS